jgi:hypothetical protein
MPVKFEVDVNSKQFEGKLRLFSSSLGGIFRELMETVGRDMVAAARGRAAAAFTSRTGKLLNSINFIPADTGGVFTTKKSLHKSNAFYSLFVEKGADLKPRKKKYLVFKINGEWKKVPSARIRPRPFMGPVYDEYWEGPGAKGYEALKKALQQKMNEYLGG